MVRKRKKRQNINRKDEYSIGRNILATAPILQKGRAHKPKTNRKAEEQRWREEVKKGVEK